MKNKKLKKVFNREKGICFYCGGKVSISKASVEHILSVSNGDGKELDHPFNLALSHKRCNVLAGSLPVVWKVKLREVMREAYHPELPLEYALREGDKFLRRNGMTSVAGGNGGKQLPGETLSYCRKRSQEEDKLSKPKEIITWGMNQS